jgi:hypothetical protein
LVKDKNCLFADVIVYGFLATLFDRQVQKPSWLNKSTNNSNTSVSGRYRLDEVKTTRGI